METLSIIKRLLARKHLIIGLFVLGVTIIVYYIIASRTLQAVWVTAGENPSFSPDGQWIALTHVIPEGTELFVVNADGTQRLTLTDTLSLGTEVHWISNEDIVHIHDNQFWKININTLEQSLLIDAHFSLQNTRSFSISASGYKLAFTQRKEGGNQIYVYDLIAKELSFIDPPTTWDCYEPTFSPDENWLLYQCVRDDKSTARTQVWLTDLTTMSSELITTEGFYNSFSWSPDGNWIMFTGSGCIIKWFGCSNVGVVPVEESLPKFDEEFRLYFEEHLTVGGNVSWSFGNEMISFSGYSKKSELSGIWIVTLPKRLHSSQ